MKLPVAFGLAITLGFGSASMAAAQNAPSQSSRSADLTQQLQQLRELRREMSEQMQEFDRRIQAIEKALQVDTVPYQPKQQVATRPEQPVTETPAESPDSWGSYTPGKGFTFARTELGEVNFGIFTYARYLNQRELDASYTDSFGRTRNIDYRNDLQLAKVNMSFKGWVFDPDFHFLLYTWTSNTSQGDPAQVVVGGNLGYRFNPAFNLSAGIGALPSTRSTNYTFPNWLKNDHRTIADEFFRGSYTSGIWADGELTKGLKYRTMIGNNLSQLGVNAAQLDDEFNTFSTAIWLMPTTGEYGPGEGLGDYEFHEQLATLFGVHFTHSREDAQGQPETDGFENSQIRLSDGTLIFSTDPFLTGGDIRKATYQMAALNGGFKYRGWSLEAEYYHRWVDDFESTGPIPVDELDDQGYQIQGSSMVIPKVLQAYLAYSKIDGEYGNPSDVSVGINWFPLSRREVRMNVQGLYLDDSPVGYSSVPFAVGGNGWVFSTDLIMAF